MLSLLIIMNIFTSSYSHTKHSLLIIVIIFILYLSCPHTTHLHLIVYKL